MSRSFFRRILSISFIQLLNILFKTNIRYFNGNSIVPRQIIEENNFISRGFTINSEIIIYALKQRKLTPVEVPFQLKPRIGGKEKAITIKNFLNVMTSTLKVYKKYRV